MKLLVQLALISAVALALACSTTYTARNAYQFEYKVEPYSVLAGKVETGPESKPVAARVSFPGTLINPVECPPSGIFCATVPPGTYFVKLEADGFHAATFPVVLAPGQSLARDFLLQPVKPPDIVIVETDPGHPWNIVYFDPGSAVISDDNLQKLDRAAVMLIECMPARVEIRGYTDSVGDEYTNDRLSQARADAVRNYLVRCGVDPSLLVTKGCGENAGFDNETRKGKILNRRVELVPFVWR